MCHFAITDFRCGDWKWGNMMERCPRQHRIGEACGATLIHEDFITKRSALCKTCYDIEVKNRQLRKIESDIRRWTFQEKRMSASLDKARNERHELLQRIKVLHSKRQSVKCSLNTQLDTVHSALVESQPTQNVAAFLATRSRGDLWKQRSPS